MNEKIRLASVNNVDQLALIISNSNKDVAENFGITFDNNPKHPSFCTRDWVFSDLEKGEKYFLYRENNEYQGCVAFKLKDAETAYLNRLSVLPMYRNAGIGERLVTHIFEYSKSKNIKKISIGIIAKHDSLEAWYLKLGFKKSHTKKISHLPFDVTFMDYEL